MVRFANPRQWLFECPDSLWKELRMNWEYEELTANKIGVCFDVINELGEGFIESVYERALVIALRQKGMKAEPQVPMKVVFRDEVIGDFVADILVEDKIIIELKAVKALTPQHQAQLINYLTATGLHVGLLVNFGSRKLEWNRAENPKLRRAYRSLVA